jgi:hypothetical protein
MNQNPNDWAGFASVPVPCSRCGSKEITVGITFSLGVEAGQFGLSHKAFGPFRGTEKVVADLCQSCGTIQRMYVRNTQRKWDISK